MDANLKTLLLTLMMIWMIMTMTIMRTGKTLTKHSPLSRALHPHQGLKVKRLRCKKMQHKQIGLSEESHLEPT